MRDCPQQIGPKFFPVCLGKCFLPVGNSLALLLQGGGSGACDQRDGKHTDKCDRIAVKRKIKLKIRIRKEKIDGNHTKQGSNDPIQKTRSMQGGKDQSQRIDHSDVRCVLVPQIKKTK